MWAREAHQDCRLVELFGGGAAVTFGLVPDRALVNDINPHVINFYRWVKAGLAVGEVAMVNAKTEYYKHRNRFNALVASGHGDTSEAALLFYYLNRTCYRGLCRFNRKGKFNVPYGKYTTITYDRLSRNTSAAKALVTGRLSRNASRSSRSTAARAPANERSMRVTR